MKKLILIVIKRGILNLYSLVKTYFTKRQNLTKTLCVSILTMDFYTVVDLSAKTLTTYSPRFPKKCLVYDTKLPPMIKLQFKGSVEFFFIPITTRSTLTKSGWLVRFYGITTFVVYSTPNPLYTYYL